MPGNLNGLQSLAKSSKLPVERIRFVPDADEATVRSIRRGVLFLMAFWSVSARVVADVDGSPALYELPEFRGKVHGYGETAWVRDGGIVATSGLGMNTACFEQNTRSLPSMP